MTTRTRHLLRDVGLFTMNKYISMLVQSNIQSIVLEILSQLYDQISSVLDQL